MREEVRRDSISAESGEGEGEGEGANGQRSISVTSCLNGMRASATSLSVLVPSLPS